MWASRVSILTIAIAMPLERTREDKAYSCPLSPSFCGDSETHVPSLHSADKGDLFLLS